MKRVLIVLFAVLLPWPVFATANDGMDWPHFLGPNYDMTSNEKGLMREWPAEGLKVLWRTNVLIGWSCPSVSGNDLVLAMTEFEPENHRQATAEHIVCCDASTGKERWRYSYKTSYNGNSVGWADGGVRGTPAITETCVYGIDPLCNVKCLDRRTGRLLWDRAFKPDFFFAPGVEQKGYNNSPIVIDNVLVLHGATGIDGKHFNWAMGLDAMTGKQLWLNEDEGRTKGIHYVDGGGTAIPIQINGETCDLASYNAFLRAYRVRDGREIMKYRMFTREAHNTGGTPQVVGNRAIILPFAAPLTCAEINLQNPSLTTNVWESWDYYGNGGYHNYIEHDGYMYGVNGYNTDGNDVKGKTLTLECIDFRNGKRVWSQGGIVHGYSYTVADGLMFLRTFQTLSLVELNPAKFVLKSRMEKIHAVDTVTVTDSRGLGDCVMPVLSRGRLFVRTPTELICFKVSRN